MCYLNVDKITDVVLTIKDELDSGHELPNHSGVGEEEIPVIGMSFGSLPLAHKFYANYAKKVGFVTKIRNTNFDKAQKESKIPVNQSIYCTREAYQESRVNAATRANRITATRCRARMYVILDKEKGSWVVSRLELRHSHPCSAKKAVHYHEYRKLTMHAKCVITDNDEAQIRPNKTYLALANEVGGLGLPFASFVGVNYHGKSTLLGCALLGSEEIPSFEWVFTQWVKCVGTMPREIITDQCKAMAGAIRKVLPDTVHRWCIWHIMKKSQFKLSGYARYEELNAMMNHIVWNSPSTESFEVDWAVPSCYVLPRWSKNVIRKHTYIKSSHDVARSDESNNLFRHLCSEFYNVAQEFIACDEEAAILQAALWEAKSKLTDYRASMRSTTVAATQNTMPTQSTGGAIVHDIPGPSRPKDD
ncbi:hypothetical protein Ahy_B07g087160 [Arachis hypogaea]|uniref:Uncharacterized protein n=1 Tax=Arachis hypogaea TaxID=3818 RepID=A0A444YBD5_ARAHY|nr:hypothetical protein Ahy_B07g087160 [Arachis hypogaea]